MRSARHYRTTQWSAAPGGDFSTRIPRFWIDSSRSLVKMGLNRAASLGWSSST
jgi:hypothetical protein